MGKQVTSDGFLRVQPEPIEGSKLTLISPNWCDRTTWYEKSVRVENELFVSDDHITYDSDDSHAWVDVMHGKITEEHNLRAIYAPIVMVNDIEQRENSPETSDGDFTVEYRLGQIIFNSALQDTDVVKVSYSYINGSEWSIKPNPGQKIRVTEVEVQFSEDIELNDSIFFELYINGKVYGKPVIYQTMYDYINAASRSYPIIPKLGGDTWRGMKSSVYIFRWDYKTTTDLKSSLKMEIKVRLEREKEFRGNFATATFYGISMAEPQ